MAILDKDGWITSDHKHLPDESGCYVVLLGGNPLYAGKAVSLKKRFRLHQIDYNRCAYKNFEGDPSSVTVKYLPMPKDQLAAFERRLIAELNPPLNERLRSRY